MKKLLYILFHRSVLIGLSIIAQIAVLALLILHSASNFYWLFVFLSIVAALAIIGSRMEPGYKIAWLLLVLPFPVLGGAFFLMVGGGYVPKRTRRRMQGLLEKSSSALREDFKADDLLTLGGDAVRREE